MNFKKRIIIGTIFFLVIPLLAIQIADKLSVLYNEYKLFGRIVPSYTKDQKINDKEEIVKFFLRKERIIALYQGMKDTHELLVKNNIQYFADSGTLLGALRNNGQIPYDDDLDILILQEDGPKVKRLKGEFEKLGYKFKEKYKDWDVISNSDIALDIFYIAKHNGRYRYASIPAHKAFPKFIIDPEELFPAKMYKFGDIMIYGPNDPIKYLKRAYGDDVMEYAVFSGTHNGGPIGRTLKVKISDLKELQIPAQPTGPLKNNVK
jgi:lipopolysaccharide cholinephosphotransferase